MIPTVFGGALRAPLLRLVWKGFLESLYLPWTPKPNTELPESYQREGPKIGDAGTAVPDDGSFDVFFNITLP